MDVANPIPDATDQQKAAQEISAVAFDWYVGPLLNAQADLLVGAEVSVSDWLHRRHEAVVDARQLIARVRGNTDPADALKAQQEWMSRSLRRLAADANAYHSVARQVMDHAASWFPTKAWPWFPSEAETGSPGITHNGPTHEAARDHATSDASE